jgi:5-formyltetrahydrofolate cyclo-ligase
MLKKAIREEFLQERLNIADNLLLEQTARIIGLFSSLKLPVVNYLLSYYPLTERKEFDVSLCATVVREEYPRCVVAWPRIEADMKTMEAYQIQEDGLYAKNKFNILEPINGEWVPPELIDLVFVPLVAVDLRGYRVGYGKGFYDRYLARCRPETVKVGFSFFEPLERIDDINEFDVPLSFCITPSRIYEF